MLEHVYEQIRIKFGVDSVARYYGGVPDEEREKAVADFQAPDSGLQWIVANQQSMGYGRTLTRGLENHYVSNGYNLEHRLQSEDRTMRLGQTESVLYNDYYSPGTVNEKIYVNLRGKKSMMSEILGTPLGSWI
jgi:SNF2 family DNA or RNA helicase